MAKTSNLYARIEPEVKEQAEMILSALGIPVSSAINMFYKQIILQRGIPFEMKLPSARPLVIGEMTREQFNAEMHAGLDDIRTLFAESPSRFVISVKKENADKFEKLMAGTPLKRAGETNSSDAVAFRKDGKSVLTITCDEIVKAWKREI